jgi:hypothetical protein
VVRGAVQFRQRVQAMRDAAEDERGYERDRMEEVKADVFRRRAEARRSRADAAAAERASHREQEEEAEEARRQAEMDEAQRTFQMALSGKLDARPKKKVSPEAQPLAPTDPCRRVAFLCKGVFSAAPETSRPCPALATPLRPLQFGPSFIIP